MNKKAVLFDLDGTLVDTLMDLYTARNYAYNKNGFPSIDIAQTKRDISNGVRTFVSLQLPGKENYPEFEKVLNDFITYYTAHYNVYTKPIPFSKEILEHLHKKGFMIGVVTNKKQEIAQSIIDFYFPGLVDVVVGNNPLMRRKPNPDMAEAIIDKFAVNKEEVILIGDSEVDYLTSQNANIECALILSIFRTKEELLAAGVKCPIYNGLNDIINIF